MLSGFALEKMRPHFAFPGRPECPFHAKTPYAQSYKALSGPDTPLYGQAPIGFWKKGKENKGKEGIYV